MDRVERIRTALERNVRAVTLRPAIGQGTAVTRVRLVDGLACEVEDGRFRLRTDMSPKSGGEGEAPDPGVLGRAALGSCLAVGYATWAAQAGVRLRALDVRIEADYDVRSEYGVGDVPPGYREIRALVSVESPDAEEEVLRVLDEADARSTWLAMIRAGTRVHREVRFLSGVE